MSWDNVDAALKNLQTTRYSYWDNYLGFYSSWLGGYFREPWAMLMPMDDHGFHRGDGVFEAARIVDHAYFDLREHLLRLKTSALAIGMELPKSLEEIENICVELARRCHVENGLLRLYVTRGPGGFSPSPKEVIGHQIYAAITKLAPPSAEKYQSGVSALISTVAAKEPFWSKIKSCNYLQNVLMKRECIEKGFDFAISVDLDGRLCEGSTENMMLINAKGEMLVPKFDYTLRGTTIRVVMKLAEKTPGITGVHFADLKLDDLLNAKEAAFIGTTLAVLPISKVGDRHIPVGPLCQGLNNQLNVEMKTNASLRTNIL